MEVLPMRVVTKLSLAIAVIAGSLSFSAIAQANEWHRDRDHWRYDHDRGRHYGHYDRYVHGRPIVVRERPVIVERERPIFVAPQPMYMAPQGPSGVNLNFNIPLN